MRSNFKSFQLNIKELGGVWNTDDVYFSQMRDGYSATYKPNYPLDSKKDMIIQTIKRTGAYLRGNLELIRKKDNSFHSEYFNSFNELKMALED